MLKIYTAHLYNIPVYYFIDKKTGYGFSVIMNPNLDKHKLDYVSPFKQFDQSKLGTGVTMNSKAGKKIADYFNTAVELLIKDWKIDDLQVEVLQSGGGYYAGCYYYSEYGGPYCRISGYSRYKEVINHWLVKHSTKAKASIVHLDAYFDMTDEIAHSMSERAQFINQDMNDYYEC